jgi:hypothetical protein
MRTIDELLNEGSSHSGSGISYYRSFHDCARRANLAAQRKSLELLAAPEDESDDIVATDRGTAYHKLHEGLARLEIRAEDADPVVIDARRASYSASKLEALRLFRAWTAQWTSLPVKYGCKIIGAELAVGSSDAPIPGIGHPLSGRLDALIEIDEAGLADTFAHTGLVLPGPGLYILDHKSATAKNKTDELMYEFALQGACYSYLWSQQDSRPIMGTIYDQIVAHKKITNDSFMHFFQAPGKYDLQILQAFVAGSVALRDSNQCNASKCISKFEKPTRCPFLGTECNRF